MLRLDPENNIDVAKYQKSCAAVFFGVMFILTDAIYSLALNPTQKELRELAKEYLVINMNCPNHLI